MSLSATLGFIVHLCVNTTPGSLCITFSHYEPETSFRFPSCLSQLNLKFEIEVLCKNLSLDINDLKPGNLLKDKEKLKSLEEQLSAPKKEAKPPEELLPVSTTGGSTQDFHTFTST